MDLMTRRTRPDLERQARNHRLAMWQRLGYWCQANAGDHGHAPAYAGQLRTLLGTGPGEVSRAIRLAKDRGLLDDTSHAGCLVLPGHAHHPCDAHHRETA